MAKARDYQSEYSRRNQLAHEAGWNSYSQQRTAKQKFKTATLDVQAKWNRFRFNHMNMSKADEARAFRAYWQGFIDPRTREDTSRDSPKAEWLVYWTHTEIFHGSYDIWEEMYDN